MADLNLNNSGVPQWYVIQTYAGYENTVEATLRKTVENRHLQDQIITWSIPVEKVTEINDAGVAKEVERKVFPGYVLVKMIMNNANWYIVRNIRGVTGFIGTENNPIPMTEDEVLALGVEKREIVVPYEVGDSVRIMDGPYTGFSSVVEAIDLAKEKVTVAVIFAGRELPVELDLDSVEVIAQ